MNTFNLKTQSGRLAFIISETGLTKSRFGEEVEFLNSKYQTLFLEKEKYQIQLQW